MTPEEVTDTILEGVEREMINLKVSLLLSKQDIKQMIALIYNVVCQHLDKGDEE